MSEEGIDYEVFAELSSAELGDICPRMGDRVRLRLIQKKMTVIAPQDLTEVSFSSCNCS